MNFDCQIDASHELQLTNGMVIAVPVPAIQAARSEPIERATQAALKECVEKGIEGRDVTPFLLQRVNELTGGKSLEASKCIQCICR